MSNTLLRVHPSDLRMPFELKKNNSACLELFNKTDQWVAFKVKTTAPKKYAVRPASGVVPPRGSCGVTITMQAPRVIPPDYHCKDKFLVQSIAAEEGMTQKDIVPGMFSKAPGKIVEELKLRVIYVPANPPSPVPEETEEEDGCLDSDVDHEVGRPSTFNSETGQAHRCRSQASDAKDDPTTSKIGMESRSVSKLELESRCTQGNKKIQKELVQGDSVSKLELESRCTQENKKIQTELDLLRETKASSPGGFTTTFVLLVFLLSSLIGYLMFGNKS